MGAPVGNQNALKPKHFYDALLRICKQNDFKKLNSIAEKLVECAIAGEPWAVKEIMDRIDGKPIQATSFENPDGTAITGLKVVFVNATESE